MECAIRKIRRDDANQLMHCANNRRIWLNLRDYFPHPYTLEDAHSFIEMCASHPLNKVFAITLSDKFIGIVGIHPMSDIYRHTAEIGYWLGEDFWGKGFTSFAVDWMIKYTWSSTDIVRLEAGVFAHNLASMAVLEKHRFIKECVKTKRIIKDGIQIDEHFYALLRPQLENI